MFDDLRLACRALRKSPAFAVAAVLILTVAIGANTAIFSAINTLLVRDPPLPASERLVVVHEVDRRSAARAPLPYDRFVAVQNRIRSLAGAAGYEDAPAVRLSTGSIEIEASRATPNLFEVLGVTAQLGRVFTSHDAAANVTVLTDRVWRSRFNSDPSVLGRELPAGGLGYTIVGVLPADFRLLYSSAGAWVPEANFRASPSAPVNLVAVGRLAASANIASLNAELHALSEALAAETPQDREHRILQARTWRTYMVAAREPVMALAAGATVLLLVTACLNIGGLFLARVSGRSAEFAIRRALGAGRSRLVRLLMAETLVVACMGACLGTLLVTWLRAALIASVPALADIVIDFNVLAFTAAAAVLSAVAIGVGPAVFSASESVRTHRTRSGRMRRIFVGGQTAIATTLLVVAGALFAGLLGLREVEPGFASQGIAVAEVRSIQPQTNDPNQRAQTLSDLERRIATLPGVEAVAYASRLPLFGVDGASLEVAGPSGHHTMRTGLRSVSPGYLQVFGIPVLRGRGFTEADTANAAPVALINRRAAEVGWPDRDAIGTRVRIDGRGPWREIVGITADTRSVGLRSPAVPEVMLPQAQSDLLVSGFAARTSRNDPAALLPLIRRAVSSSGFLLSYENSMDALMAEQTALPTALAAFSGGFAALTLAMAATGLFGVLAILTAERAKEIAIRAALGASGRANVALVLRSGVLSSAAGVTAGVGLGYGLTRLLRSVLEGAISVNPGVALLCALFVVTAGAAASWLPAWRAAHCEPATALRHL